MTAHKSQKQASAPHKQRTPMSLHKAINWIVSCILLVFAIWSINTSTQGQSLFKQANQLHSDIDLKLVEVKTQLGEVKDACLKAPVVIPQAPVTTTTTTTQ